MNENNNTIIDWEEKFKKSGMTIEEWNNYILKSRDDEIAKKVEAVRQERLEVEQKTNFIVNEISRVGHEQASKIIVDAKQYPNNLSNSTTYMQLDSTSNTSIADNNFSNIANAWVENSREVINNARVEAEKKYNEFIAARENQRQQDKILREQQLAIQKQETNVTNESIGGKSI